MCWSLYRAFWPMFEGVPKVVESGLRDCGKSEKDFHSGEFELHPPRVLTQMRSRLLTFILSIFNTRSCKREFLNGGADIYDLGRVCPAIAGFSAFIERFE